MTDGVCSVVNKFRLLSMLITESIEFVYISERSCQREHTEFMSMHW